MLRLCRFFLICIAAVAAILPLVHASCSASKGPVNAYNCISIPRYNGWQYATCLTNAYIQTKSGGRHICEDRTATYCYYQCMIEFHDLNFGTVTTDCSCDPSRPAVTPTPGSVGTTLPPRCYSPTGEDCSWYTDCLERKVACGPETGYALAFGKKYCELYNNNYLWFSDLTRRWVDAVRKCLQVSLVPLMRDFYQPSCQEVKEMAIRHHTQCYLAPALGQPSICDVIKNRCWDIFQIMFTIRGAFYERDLTVFHGTWKSFFEVTWHCKFDFFVGCVADPINATYQAGKKVIEFTVDAFKAFGRGRRAVGLDPGQVAVDFAAALSDRMAWRERGIEWIPMSVKGDSSITFQLLLGDQRLFNLNRNYSGSVDLDQEVQNVQARLRSGDLLFSLSDGGQYYARQLSDCADSNCTSVRSSARAPAEPRGAQQLRPHPWILATILVVSLANGFD